jgi:hypothetical protein
MMLDNIDHYTARIRVLDEKIAELCEPYERQIAQLDAVPGYGITTAQDIIAEIGTGMSVFPTQLVITHALLSGPEAEYEDLGTDYYERRADIRRRIRGHVRSLEHLGCRVTVEAPHPETGEYLPIATAS